MCENGKHEEALRRIAAMRCAIAESAADWNCRSAGKPEAEWCAVCIAAAALEPAPAPAGGNPRKTPRA